TETAFFAPVAGTVREVSVRPSQRVDAGDVLLVIEPSSAGAPGSGAACLLLPPEADPLEALFDPETDLPDLPATARKSGAVRAQAIRALRAETRRILM